MVTVGAAPAVVFGAGGLGGSVAVAVGALVVVLAIVLVFIMVLRSNGAARKTASGLGYDAQHGPLGQPQPDAASPWQRQAMQQQPGWQQEGDFGAGAKPAATPGRMPSAAWGQTQDYPGSAGMPASPSGQQGWGAPQGQGSWNDAPAQPSAPAWPGASDGSSGDQWASPASGWNSAQSSPNRPAAPAAAPWDQPAPAASGGAGGRSPWGSPVSGQPAAPWDQPEASAPSWGGTPAAGGQPDWGAPASAAPAGAAGWGMDQAAPSRPDWGTPAAPSAPQDWNAAPAAPQRQAPPAAAHGWDAPAGQQGAPGFDAAFGEDKTRVVRPNNPQRPGMIVVRQGKEPGRIYEVRKERLTIGRSRESDIFLEDLAVSRLHTTVGRDESGRYIIRDENSANGTYVNGQRVTEHVLEEGDEIQVGQTVLAFVRR